jgi:hypothetical protein
VQDDYLSDDTGQETVDKFFEAYLLWLFGFVLFYSSQGDAVARYLIPHAQRCSLARPAPYQLGQLCSCGNVQGPVLGGVEGSFGGADPSRMSSFFSSGATSGLRLVGQSSPSTLRAAARGPRPARPFHHGLIMAPPDSNFLPFTFNLSFHFV